MTAWAPVCLFWTLLLKTEDTNSGFSVSYRFGNLGGSIIELSRKPLHLGNYWIHQIWRLDKDLKKSNTFSKRGHLTALSVLCLILHGVFLIIAFVCSIIIHSSNAIEVLRLSAKRHKLSVWISKECTDRLDRYIRLTGCQRLWWSANIRNTITYTRNWGNGLTWSRQTSDSSSIFINTRKIHAVLLPVTLLVSVFW